MTFDDPQIKAPISLLTIQLLQFLSSAHFSLTPKVKYHTLPYGTSISNTQGPSWAYPSAFRKSW